MRDHLRLVTFDLDDTLWECAPVIHRAEQALFDWLKQHYPRITDRFDQHAMREVRTRAMRDRPELRHDLTRLRIETLRWHARQAGYDPAMAEAGFDVFIGMRNRVELYEDVEPVLARLRAHYRLAALTNGNACVHRVGLGEYFDLALSAADAGASKPEPAMFHLARRRLGLRPDQVLHVGDVPTMPVLPASGSTAPGGAGKPT